LVVINFNKDENTIDNRWYTKEQVFLGKEVFLKNCASCHGEKAEKTVDWKKMLSDGSYPSPPLNDNDMLGIILNGN
jgi:mono/diheme cytochrome c family protein